MHCQNKNGRELPHVGKIFLTCTRKKFHVRAQKRSSNGDNERLIKIFNNNTKTKLKQVMALKVKAQEKLQKIGTYAGKYRYIMMPELYTSLSQEKVINRMEENGR